MPKMTKSMLKEIVKECLVEILAEGIGTTKKHAGKKNKHRARPHGQDFPTNHRAAAMDRISFEKRVDESVGMITQDPMMASIFADTAANSLQEQIAAEPRHRATSGLAAPSEPLSPSEDPMAIFGESAANWSHLAFAEKKA